MVLPQAPFLLGDRASLGVGRHTGQTPIARWKRVLGRRTRKSYPASAMSRFQPCAPTSQFRT